MIQEQKAWIAELEKGKAWLEEQWKAWQRVAEELERSKAWLEEQGRSWQESRWGRLGLRLGILKPFSPIPPETDQETD